MGHGNGSGAVGAGVVEGLAIVAGALAELPAVRARALGEVEAGVAGERLRSGWDLAAFTPTGAAAMGVLEAGGAAIEVVGGVPATWGVGRRAEGGVPRGCAGGRQQGVDGGVEGVGGAGGVQLPRVTSHGADRAARGAPPGRRATTMGIVPGPRGSLLRMSCGVVLRLPAAALADPVAVASMLAWHAALHAAERRRLPSAPAVAEAVEELVRLVPPDDGATSVAWATAIADRVAIELGAPPVPWPLPAAGTPV